MKSFKSKLQKFRKDNNLSQNKLAEILEINSKTLWNKENFNGGEFTFSELVKMKEIYRDLDMNWLLTKGEERE